jgi:hypothetical protein
LVCGEVQALAEGLALGLTGPKPLPPTFFFNGVAASPSGTIYVSGDAANVVYRIDRR